MWLKLLQKCPWWWNSNIGRPKSRRLATCVTLACTIGFRLLHLSLEKLLAHGLQRDEIQRPRRQIAEVIFCQMDHPLAKPGPKRCLIICSRKKFDQHIGDDEYFIRRAIKFASGEYSKVFHIGTRKAWRRVSILFDYDNPDHYDSDVLAFRVKKTPRYINLTAGMTATVHRQAKRWIDDHKRYGSILPIRTEVYITSCRLI